MISLAHLLEEQQQQQERETQHSQQPQQQQHRQREPNSYHHHPFLPFGYSGNTGYNTFLVMGGKSRDGIQDDDDEEYGEAKNPVESMVDPRERRLPSSYNYSAVLEVDEHQSLGHFPLSTGSTPGETTPSYEESEHPMEPFPSPSFPPPPPARSAGARGSLDEALRAGQSKPSIPTEEEDRKPAAVWSPPRRGQHHQQRAASSAPMDRHDPIAAWGFGAHDHGGPGDLGSSIYETFSFDPRMDRGGESRGIPPAPPPVAEIPRVAARQQHPVSWEEKESRSERRTLRPRNKKRSYAEAGVENPSWEETERHVARRAAVSYSDDEETRPSRASARLAIPSELHAPLVPPSIAVAAASEGRRFEPTDEELRNCPNERLRGALMTFYDRLNELAHYRDEHGHCNVPQKYPENRPLGVWVNKQRMEKKQYDENEKSSLTPRRIALLESIGFSWGDRKGIAKWEENFGLLVEYFHTQGHCNVPTKYRQNPKLGRWVSTQRSEFKKFMEQDPTSKITQEQIDRLNQMNFRWNMLDRVN